MPAPLIFAGNRGYILYVFDLNFSPQYQSSGIFFIRAIEDQDRHSQDPRHPDQDLQ